MVRRAFCWIYPAALCCAFLPLAIGRADEPAAAVADSPPPPEVFCVRAKTAEVIDYYYPSSARLEAINTVELRPLVSGVLTKVHFRGGETVKQGDLLFELDDRQAQLELQKAEAELAAADARAKYAAVNAQRAKKLAEQKALDTAELEKALAEAQAADLAIQSARASVQLTRLRLEACKVTAPFAGQISQPRRSAGNVVNAADDPLATLVANDQLCVEFQISQTSLLKLRKQLADKQLPGAEGQKFPVEMTLLDDERKWQHQALAEFTGNSFITGKDEVHGRLLVRAYLPKLPDKYYSGMTAYVRVPISGKHTAVVLTGKVLNDSPSEQSVVVVNANNELERRVLKIGPVHGDPDGRNLLREITDGMKEGEYLVQQSLPFSEKNFAGKKVRVKEYPSAE